MKKEEQKKHLIDMMQKDEESGLYDVFNDEKRQGVKELIDKHKQGRDKIENDFLKCLRNSKVIYQPKQETLEEAAEKWFNKDGFYPDPKQGFISGAKWQQETMYSEEEVLEILYKHTEDLLAGKKITLEEWFEQFKKK